MHTPGTPDHRAGHYSTAPTAPSRNLQNKAIPKWLDPTLEQADKQKVAHNNQSPAENQRSVSAPPDTADEDTYRLNDEIYLCIKTCEEHLGQNNVTGNNIDENSAYDADPYGPEFCDHPELKFLSELHRTTLESQHLLKPISDKHAATGQYLKNLNKRFGLLQQFIIAASTWADLRPNYQVALKETGLNFYPKTGNIYRLDQHVHLQIVLFPSLAHLCIFARITQLETIDEKVHLGLTFDALQPAEQQILAKHILQKQIDQRRKRQPKPQ